MQKKNVISFKLFLFVKIITENPKNMKRKNIQLHKNPGSNYQQPI